MPEATRPRTSSHSRCHDLWARPAQLSLLHLSADAAHLLDGAAVAKEEHAVCIACIARAVGIEFGGSLITGDRVEGWSGIGDPSFCQSCVALLRSIRK